MKIQNEKFNINLKFYFFLKNLIKIKFSNIQIMKILNLSQNSKNSPTRLLEQTHIFINTQTKNGMNQKQLFEQIANEIHNEIDFKLFYFSIKLFSLKDLLLELAKLRQLDINISLQKIDPLSLEYDKLTMYKPYSTRVEGALLSLIMFDYLEKGLMIFNQNFDGEYIKDLSNLAIKLKQHGLESNQIFMLIFNESINQSIISDSGSNYEERIRIKLNSIGLDDKSIKKKHDENDNSTEFDFFFTLENRTYGIGAKRTLRERYKQFIKTSQMSHLDVMIEITLGVDLTEEKVKAIRNHNVYLFISDEIYQQFNYLKNIKGIYSTKDLSLDLLKNLK